MSVDHTDFLDVATRLLASESEIDWRMCAGRAYYAAFHRARRSVVVCPDSDQFARGSHERLTDRYKAHTMAGRSIAYVLIEMKKIRSAADYEIEDDFSRALAVNQIATYDVLLTKLELLDGAEDKKTG